MTTQGSATAAIAIEPSPLRVHRSHSIGSTDSSATAKRRQTLRQSGQEITSPFSLLAKLRDGKIHYVQFLEDTFGTSGTLGRPRS